MSSLTIGGRFAIAALTASACLVSLSDRPASASAPSSPHKVFCGPGISPIPNFVQAKPRHMPKPQYPDKALDHWSEGWVVLNFTAAADGSVRDLIVTDSLGPKEFVDRTKLTFSKWRYDPATRDGVAVDQFGMHFVFQYLMEGVGPREAVHGAFVRRYNEARQLIREKKFAEAIAKLDSALTLRLNLYEIAMASLAFAVAHAQQGNQHQALVHIRRATIDEGTYLDKDVRSTAFALRVQLEAQDGNYKDALCAHETLLKVNPSGDVAAGKLVEKIKGGLNNPAPLAVAGKLVENAAADVPPSWWHPLLRSKFHFDQIKGDAKSFRLVCVGSVLEAAVDPEMEWQVPAAAGDCSLRVYGTSGTTFRLIEEW